jgi:hypothetical protein
MLQEALHARRAIAVGEQMQRTRRLLLRRSARRSILVQAGLIALTHSHLGTSKKVTSLARKEWCCAVEIQPSLVFCPVHSGKIGWADDSESAAVSSADGLFHTYRLAVDAAGNATVSRDGTQLLTRTGYTTNGTIASAIRRTMRTSTRPCKCSPSRCSARNHASACRRWRA